MDREELMNSGLLKEYILGLCSAKDRAIVEKMAAQDSEVAQLISKTKSDLEKYCKAQRTSQYSKVSRQNQERVGDVGFASQGSFAKLSKIRSEKEEKFGWLRSQSLIWSLVFLGALACILLTNQNSKLRKELDKNVFASNSLINKMNRMMMDYRNLEADFSFVQDLNTKMIKLDGHHQNQRVTCIVCWNKVQQKAMIKIIDLPPSIVCKLRAHADSGTIDLGQINFDRKGWKTLDYVPKASRLELAVAPGHHHKASSGYVIVSADLDH